MSDDVTYLAQMFGLPAALLVIGAFLLLMSRGSAVVIVLGGLAVLGGFRLGERAVAEYQERGRIIASAASRADGLQAWGAMREARARAAHAAAKARSESAREIEADETWVRLNGPRYLHQVVGHGRSSVFSEAGRLIVSYEARVWSKGDELLTDLGHQLRLAGEWMTRLPERIPELGIEIRQRAPGTDSYGNKIGIDTIRVFIPSATIAKVQWANLTAARALDHADPTRVGPELRSEIRGWCLASAADAPNFCRRVGSPKR